MSNKEKKELKPLISMVEEKVSKTLVHQELSDIDDIYLDLKYKSVFFYNILSKYNIYIIKYISNYLDTLYKDTIRDHIVSYLDNHLLLDNKNNLLVFRKDEIVREGKPLVNDTLKVSLEPKVILEGLSEKYPTLDLETEFEKWKIINLLMESVIRIRKQLSEIGVEMQLSTKRRMGP
jgi:hypothetical protein